MLCQQMASDIDKIVQEAQKGSLRPVYIIVGTESVLISQAHAALRKATVGDGPRGLSEDVYEAGDTRAAVVVDACKSLPMLSRWRFVHVRNVDSWRNDDVDTLVAYLENPTPSTLLVLTATKIDQRTRLATTAKKKGFLSLAEAPPEAELVPWINVQARARNASFEPGAAEALVLAIGADLDALSDALNRLHLFAGNRAIQESDVDTLVANVRESSVFDLVDAVGERNLGRAFRLLDSLPRDNEAAFYILAMVVRQVRMIARARELGGDPSALRMPPHAARKLAAQAKSWSPAHIARGLRACAQCDLRLKSVGGKGRDRLLIEELLMTLCGSSGMGEAALTKS